MHRFYLDPEFCRGASLRLSGPEAHHALTVLRVRVGEPVIILDGRGTELHGFVDHVEKHSVVLRVAERREYLARRNVVHLAVALLKGRAWDLVLEKATELGVASIQPLSAERCVSRILTAEAAAKIAGWRATTIAAAKQCGTPWLPALMSPLSPQAWLNHRDLKPLVRNIDLVASLEPGARTIRSVMAQALQKRGSEDSHVTAIVGPEGDFTPAEYTTFTRAGVEPVTLGPLVLRADTAVIAMLAIVAAELAEL